jgi:Transcription factor Iwr1
VESSVIGAVGTQQAKQLSSLTLVPSSRMLAATSKPEPRRSSFRPTIDDPVLFIRVQRRRAVTAAATLRVGLDAATATTAALADVDLTGDASNSSLNASFFNRSLTAVFRRVSDNDPLMRSTNFRDSISTLNYNTAKRPCIVDAVLVQDEDDDNDVTPEAGNPKRRKVTLQLLDTAQDSADHSSAVLMPEQVAIDTSLQRVFQGSQSVRQHCEMLQQLLPSTVIGFNAWTWCHSSMGTWLHAAALWNEAQVAEEYLSWLKSKQEGLPASSPQNVVSCLLQAVDGDDRTPFTVANQSGQSGIERVLTFFGAQPQSKCDDDDSVMYDIYCLVPPTASSLNTEQLGETSREEDVLDCEFHDGCLGYWNHQGELVLDHSTSLGDGAVDEHIDDEEDDSNDEDYRGNDYPEDEDDEDSCDESSDFRGRPVTVHRHDFNDDNEYDYDPTYSGIIAQGSLDYDSTC